MSDTLLRQLVMLRRIPRHPRKITVRELESHLDDQGYTVSERTIQRDLLTLSGRLFGLLLDDRSKPHGWCWQQHAAPLDIPSMDPQTALAFKLAEHFGQRLMAPSTVSTLEPYFRQAEQVLDDHPSPVGAWPHKIRAITRGQTLMAPVIDADVLRCIYTGLFNDRQVKARYQRRYDGQTKTYVISPLGIVFRDGVVYLVCQRNDKAAVVHLALHRFIEVEPLSDPVERPAGFDLGEYVSGGGLDFKLGEAMLNISLRLTNETATHLEETPLSEDQQLAPTSDGRIRLSATVADTLQIRWWLLGLGNQVEVISPQSLRDEIADRLAQAMAQYQTG
jgi:predicted DNA-binding transcriptional regulator YafY